MSAAWARLWGWGARGRRPLLGMFALASVPQTAEDGAADPAAPLARPSVLLVRGAALQTGIDARTLFANAGVRGGGALGAASVGFGGIGGACAGGGLGGAMDGARGATPLAAGGGGGGGALGAAAAGEWGGWGSVREAPAAGSWPVGVDGAFGTPAASGRGAVAARETPSPAAGVAAVAARVAPLHPLGGGGGGVACGAATASGLGGRGGASGATTGKGALRDQSLRSVPTSLVPPRTRSAAAAAGASTAPAAAAAAAVGGSEAGGGAAVAAVNSGGMDDAAEGGWVGGAASAQKGVGGAVVGASGPLAAAAAAAPGSFFIGGCFDCSRRPASGEVTDIPNVKAKDVCAACVIAVGVVAATALAQDRLARKTAHFRGLRRKRVADVGTASMWTLHTDAHQTVPVRRLTCCALALFYPAPATPPQTPPPPLPTVLAAPALGSARVQRHALLVRDGRCGDALVTLVARGQGHRCFGCRVFLGAFLPRACGTCGEFDLCLRGIVTTCKPSSACITQARGIPVCPTSHTARNADAWDLARAPKIFWGDVRRDWRGAASVKLNFYLSPPRPPLSIQSPVLARALALVGGGVSAADMPPGGRADRLVLELEAAFAATRLWDLGESDNEGSSDDAAEDLTSRALSGMLLRRFADTFVAPGGADAAVHFGTRAALARTFATAAHATAAADAAAAARHAATAKRSAAAAAAAERAASNAEAAARGAYEHVDAPAVRSARLPRASGAAAPSAFDASSSVAAVAASSTKDAPPTVWPAPPSLVTPHTVGASSFSAALSCMARAPCLTTSSGVARLLCSYATMHTGASIAGSHPESPWQTSSLTLLPVDASPPSLAAFAPSSFHPRPSTFHGLVTLLEMWYAASFEDLSYAASVGGGAGVAAGAGAGAGTGVDADSPMRDGSQAWYGGCLSVPEGVTTFSGIVQLLGGGGWTGIVLCLHTEMDAHYVAFCELAEGWYFFDPDFGLAGPQPILRVPLLPPGIFSQGLSRTLFRFRMPTVASDAVRHCFERKLAPSLSS